MLMKNDSSSAGICKCTMRSVVLQCPSAEFKEVHLHKYGTEINFMLWDCFGYNHWPDWKLLWLSLV